MMTVVTQNIALLILVHPMLKCIFCIWIIHNFTVVLCFLYWQINILNYTCILKVFEFNTGVEYSWPLPQTEEYVRDERQLYIEDVTVNSTFFAQFTNKGIYLWIIFTWWSFILLFSETQNCQTLDFDAPGFGYKSVTSTMTPSSICHFINLLRRVVVRYPHHTTLQTSQM